MAVPAVQPIAVARRGIDWSAILPYLALIAATILAYLPAIGGGVLWDDDAHITKPALESLHGLWRIWFDLSATQQYYPLLHSAFWLEHRFWGDATLGYHLVNILLHGVSACLVVSIARRLTLPGAWLAGYVFALHPVCVEGVAWISEQKSTLSGVLCLASALVYLKFDQSRRKLDYVLALGLFITALASKTVTATLPGALLVVLWWRRGTLRWKVDVFPLAPWFVIGAAAGLFTARVEREYIGAHGAVFDISLADRFLIAGRALWFYAAKLVWPVHLSFIYPRWKIDSGVWWQWLFPAGALLVAAGLAWFARRNRGPLAALLLFAGMLFPALGFLNVYPFRYSFVADHFQYLASLGLIVPLCALLATAARRVPRSAVALLPLVLAALTFNQTREYRDAETLYRETLVRNPACWMAHNNLGGLYAKLPGRVPDAIAEYEAALRIEPNIVEAETSLGNTLWGIPGHEEEAMGHLEKALRIDSNFAVAHYNLGVALADIPGRAPDAVGEYETAIRDGFDTPQIRVNLGSALALLPGRGSEAMEQFEEALRLDPGSAEAESDFAIALARDPDHLPDAAAHFEKALKIRPDYPEAHSNFGNALERMGRVEDAIREQREAILLRPDYAVAHVNLAGTLSRTPGGGAEALTEYQIALRLNPNMPEAHFRLAALLSDTPGRQAEAIAEYREAVRLRPDYLESHANLGLLLAAMPGRMPEALAEYEAALRINPASAEVQYDLAEALARMGRRAEAITHLEAALSVRPDVAPVRELLARLKAGQ
jgi:tetratricopeptide (TPR) repeat protein